MKYLIFLLLLVSCRRVHLNKKTSNPTAELVAKKHTYCELSKPEYELNDYVVSKCDGVLFTGLHAIGCDYASISLFEDNGRWYRDPEHKCGPTHGGASSTISKDMLTGILTYMWWSKDLAAINRMIEYGKANSWVMGECVDTVTTISKCIMSPGQISLLYDMQAGLKLGTGTTTSSADGSSDANTGFAAHLDILFILLPGSVHNAISDSELQTLKEQSERQPKNALYQAAYHKFKDGDQTIAISLLQDISKFPVDKLPTLQDNYCTEYLYQRDDTPKDWDPCPASTGVLSGTDLIFATTIIDGTYFKR